MRRDVTRWYDEFAYFTTTEQFIKDYNFLHNPHSQNPCGCWAYLEYVQDGGFVVCCECGMMFQDVPDSSEEIINFEDTSQLRCGMGGNYLLSSEGQLSTQLGKCCDSRLMQYHISTNMPYRDKAILEKSKQFTQLGQQLNINEGVIQSAKEYYKIVYDNIKSADGEKKSHRGKPLLGNIAACVWIASIDHHFPLVKEFLLDYLKIEETYLKIALNNIFALFKNDFNRILEIIQNPIDYIPMILSRMNKPASYIEPIRKDILSKKDRYKITDPLKIVLESLNSLYGGVNLNFKGVFIEEIKEEQTKNTYTLDMLCNDLYIRPSHIKKLLTEFKKAPNKSTSEIIQEYASKKGLCINTEILDNLPRPILV